MKVMGIDFTSRPRGKKPLTCLVCSLDGDFLRAEFFKEWTDFPQFEAALMEPGPWIAGIDFPFGQSRTFIEGIGWPRSWSAYVRHAESLGRGGFRNALNSYREGRPFGDREHRRATDKAAKAISPQKLYGVPVGLMFFEGAPRLVQTGVTIPLLQSGDPERIVVEAYPGVLARWLIGRDPYKNDSLKKQTLAQEKARRIILDRILSGTINNPYGLSVEVPPDLRRTMEVDRSGDHLDALLCAIQAAWAWTRREHGFGAPCGTDPLEGWIADPTLFQPLEVPPLPQLSN